MTIKQDTRKCHDSIAGTSALDSVDIWGRPFRFQEERNFCGLVRDDFRLNTVRNKAGRSVDGRGEQHRRLGFSVCEWAAFRLFAAFCQGRIQIRQTSTDACGSPCLSSL